MNEITIASLEARYQALLRDLQSRRIDQAAFISAAGDLYFQDGAGRCWAIGLQSGEWYYHDGQAWWPADPRQAEPLPLPGASDQWQPGTGYQPQARAELGPDLADERPTLPGRRLPAGAASHRIASLLAIPAKSLLMAGAMLVAILALLALPAVGAPPASGPAIAPSPRPPLGGQGSGGGGGGDGDGATGAIVGTVTDLSTGGPGEAIQVAVSGYPSVRTDSYGRYSITGLPAAEYSVSMQLDGQATPARGPVFVLVDGWSSTTVDLAYYSQGQPLPAETPRPEVADQPDQATAPPPDLPQSGAPPGPEPLAVAGLGLVLSLAGGALRLGLRQV
jgi:hypothetical protein